MQNWGMKRLQLINSPHKDNLSLSKSNIWSFLFFCSFFWAPCPVPARSSNWLEDFAKVYYQSRSLLFCWRTLINRKSIFFLTELDSVGRSCNGACKRRDTWSINHRNKKMKFSFSLWLQSQCWNFLDAQNFSFSFWCRSDLLLKKGANNHIKDFFFPLPLLASSPLKFLWSFLHITTSSAHKL